MAGSTSAITLSRAADSVPNDDTSARRSRPTDCNAAAMISAGDASCKARSSSSADGKSGGVRSADRRCASVLTDGYSLAGALRMAQLHPPIERGDAAVAGRLIEHRVALRGSTERFRVTFLFHFECV